MGLYEGDLKDTVLKKVSVDEFEPKTGESKDVVVVGYYVSEELVGKDLYSFINNGIVEFRDVEVTPNPNEDGYFMVFVELDRNENTYNNIKQLTNDISNVAGELNWEVKTHLTDDYSPLGSDEFKAALITDPADYKTREDMDKQQAEEQMNQKNQDILEFLGKSLLDTVVINENTITMTKGQNTAQLTISGFGEKEIMQDIGISESALKPLDSVMRTFNKMLGEMRAVPIDDYIVVFHPTQQQVLVTRLCSDS